MNRRLIIGSIGFLFIALIVLLVLFSSKDFKLIERSYVVDFTILDEEVLYFTDDRELKRYNIGKEQVELIGEFDAHRVEFSPDGRFISYYRNESIHVVDIRTQKTVTKLPGRTHAWQSGDLIVYLESTDDFELSYLDVGILKTYNLTTGTDRAIGSAGATSFHPLSDGEGVILEAAGEGGDVTSRLLRYELDEKNIEELVGLTDMPSTSAAPGVFTYETEGEGGLFMVKSGGDIQRVKAPFTHKFYKVVTEDMVIGEDIDRGTSKIYRYKVSSDSKKWLFDVSEVGRLDQVAVNENYMVVSTQNGLYIGGY